MTVANSFIETLSNCINWSACATYDAKHEFGFDVPEKELAGADLLAQIAQGLDAVPVNILVDTQRWLIALEQERFEQYLFASHSQIKTGAYLPMNATEYLSGFNDALAKQFGPLPASDFDGDACEIIAFRDRAFVVDLTESPTSPS